MIFVDTGAWFASMVPWDANHAAASAWLNQNQIPLFTTDYVLDETLTLLRVRKGQSRAFTFGDFLLKKQLADLYFLTEADLRDAWEVYRNFDDKEWSFTDCTSKIVMEKQQQTTAFSFDKHFRQFGGVQVGRERLQPNY